MMKKRKRKVGSAFRESSKWYIAIIVLNIVRMVAQGVDIEIPADGPVYDILVGIYGTIMGLFRYFSKGRSSDVSY